MTGFAHRRWIGGRYTDLEEARGTNVSSIFIARRNPTPYLDHIWAHAQRSYTFIDVGMKVNETRYDNLARGVE